MTNPDLSWPKPTESAFEDMVRQIVDARYVTNGRAQRVGRRGQSQGGLDVIAFAGGGYLGVQAKRYDSKKLTAAIVEADLSAAQKAYPDMTSFILATTADKDAALEAAVRAMILNGISGCVEIWAWGDIVELLRDCDLDDLLVAGIPAKTLMKGLSRQAGVPISFGGMVEQADRAASDPAWLLDASARLREGRPAAALAALQGAPAALQRIEPANVVELRLKCLIQLDRADDVVSEVREAASPACMHLAVGAFAASLIGDVATAHAWIERAKQKSLPLERADVVALWLRIESQGGRKSTDELVGSVDPELLKVPNVARALGDVAFGQDDYAGALSWYGHASEGGGEPTATQRLMVASAQVAAPAAPTLHEGIEDLRRLADQGAFVDAVALRKMLLWNLGLGEQRVGEHAKALERALECARLEPANEEGWVRALAIALDRALPIPAEAYAEMPDSGGIALLRSIAAFHASDFATALVFAKKALADANLDSRQAAGAAIVLARSENPGNPSPEMLEAWMSALHTTPDALPYAEALLRAIPTLPDGDPLGDRIAGLVRSVASTGADTSESVAFCSLLIDAGKAVYGNEFLGQLRARGEHAEVLPVLIEVLVATRRLREAHERALAWREREPGNTRSLVGLSRVLLAQARFDELWRLWEQEVSAGHAPARLWARFANLAIWMGRVREARRVMRASALPSVVTPSDAHACYQALVVTMDPRSEQFASGVLQLNKLDRESAPGVFAVGLVRGRHRAKRVVGEDTIVHLELGVRGRKALWISKGPPLASDLATVSPDEVWLAPLIGARVGARVLLAAGPFDGVEATVLRIELPSQRLHEAALQLAELATAAEGGVERIEGSTAQLLERMESQLVAQDQARRVRLQRAVQFGLPIQTVAKLFERSRRAFFFRDEHWFVATHAGTREAIAEDDFRVGEATRLVLDATAVLMVVTTGAQCAFIEKVVVSAQTCAALREIYLIERGSVRGAGHAYRDAGGGVAIVPATTHDRVAHGRFWRAVHRFVCMQAEVIDCDDDEAMHEVAGMDGVLEDSVCSSISLAIAYGWTVLSEENAIRAIAANTVKGRAVSLQRWVAGQMRKKHLTQGQCARILAGLIALGGRYTCLPLEAFVGALTLPGDDAKRVLVTLFTVIAESDPESSISVLVDMLDAARVLRQKGRTQIPSEAWLMDQIRKSIRRHEGMRSASADRVLQRFAGRLQGRRWRAFRRLCEEWAAQRPPNSESGGS